MLLQCLLSVTAVLLAVAGADDTEAVKKRELAGLAGRWVIVAGEFDGSQLPIDKGKDHWQFVGKQVTTYTAGKKVDTATVEIEVDEEPKWIDLTAQQLDKESQTSPRTKGLYRLQGDELKVAITMTRVADAGTPEEQKQRAIDNGRKRPRSFDTRGGEVFVMTFERDRSAPVDATPPFAVRKWTSKASKKAVEAELIAVEDGIVRLKRADGKEFSVPLEKLSDEDQEYVRNRPGEPEKND